MCKEEKKEFGQFINLQPINMKESKHFTEQRVQKQIADDPRILGLGDLELRDRERHQFNAGRLDLLLQHPETLKRFEVEIQLGATDESHIIRTIEYWDLERKRYPQYEHAAVIVAEDITSRFLNVIQLFNGAIPLIALKMTAYRVGEDYALTFVKVLDEFTYGTVDDDEPSAEPADRSFWETKVGTETLNQTDDLFRLVNEVEKRAIPKYTKSYIGIEVEGAPFNFVLFQPRKAYVIMRLKLPRTPETDQHLDGAGLVQLNYDTPRDQYQVRINGRPNNSQREVLLELVQKAKDGFRRLA